MKLNEELIKIYEEKNFTKSAVIDDLIEARKQAKDKQDLTNLNRSIETSIKLLAMEPNKKTKTDELEMDFSREISEGMKKEKGRITARRTTDDEDEMEVLPEPNQKLQESEIKEKTQDLANRVNQKRHKDDAEEQT